MNCRYSTHYGILDTDHTGMFKYLLEILLEHSESKVDNVAMKEWLPTALQYDDERKGECLCNQKGLHELYTITNMLNKTSLSFIGSSCIKRFGSDDMKVRMRKLKKEYKKIEREGETVFQFGRFEGVKIKDIIHHKDYMNWLLENRKPSSCKNKNEAYKKLLRYYDLKVNGLELKIENVSCPDKPQFELTITRDYDTYHPRWIENLV